MPSGGLPKLLLRRRSCRRASRNPLDYRACLRAPFERASRVAFCGTASPRPMLTTTPRLPSASMPYGRSPYNASDGRRTKRVNRDFRDLLAEFNAHGVEYIVVGAHALAAHGHVRATKDLDVWVRPAGDGQRQARPRSARFLRRASPRSHRGRSDDTGGSLSNRRTTAANRRLDGDRRGDLRRSVAGSDADGIRGCARSGSLEAAHTIQNKRAAGRTQDLADIEYQKARLAAGGSRYELSHS